MKHILYTLSVLFLLGSISAYADIVVIAHDGANVTAIAKNEIKDIYTGKKTVWDDGNKIAFCSLESGQAQKEFLRTYVQKSPVQFSNFWRRQLFLGKAASIPPFFKTMDEIVRYVSSTPNSIGYISSNTDISNANVKKIQVIR